MEAGYQKGVFTVVWFSKNILFYGGLKIKDGFVSQKTPKEFYKPDLDTVL